MTCQEAVDRMGEALVGDLRDDQRVGFEAHLSICSPCATYFDHLAITRQVLRRLPPESDRSPHREELIEHYRRHFRDESADRPPKR